MELFDIFDLDLVEKRITQEKLDSRLEEGIKNKVISGEQWFRKPENWYSITAYANPYKTPYKELKILMENSEKIKPLISKTLKVFYGIGIADSENIIAEWDLENEGYSEIIGIDCMNQFIEGFVQSLRNMTYDYPKSKIMFKGINDVFENLTKNNIIPSNSKFNCSTHICLGNTIGNFEQEKIFEIFNRNMNKNDFLLIGLQLNKNEEKILTQYKNNPRFEKLILDSIGFKLKTKKIIWDWNQKEGQIEAWSDDILVFRSKKFDTLRFENFIQEHSFSFLNKFVEGDIVIYLFKKR